jgi:hypothetical protein
MVTSQFGYRCAGREEVHVSRAATEIPRTDVSSSPTAVPRTAADARAGNRPVTVWARRAMLGLMALAVVAALFSVFGVHASQTSTQSQGYRIDVVYPRVARPGLDVPWQVTVTRPGGFGKQLTLAVDGAYLNLFESQGFRPQPSDETREGDVYYLTFSAPPGDTFRVYFDAYIQPASQVGRTGWVAVVHNGLYVGRTEFSTWLWP